MTSDVRTIAVLTMFAWSAPVRGDDEHWAYVPPQRPDPASARSGPPSPDPIDDSIRIRLAAAGLEPSPPADPATLARRVALDLTGLPPTREAVATLRAEPAHYERYVDELLASPHYGERMATMWLDLARYADTVGYHGDQNLHAFPYRDWVVNAFNSNLPFDRFTVAQLAGDLLPDSTLDDRVASGFNRLNMVTREGGAQPGEYLAKYAADRVRTVATTWLGSTLGCAECHDHKYDPFTTRDFYSFAAFFADVKQWGVYTTYAYTPNPDLAGFTNDHPFPPEIEVEVPYLIERSRRIRTLANAIALDAGAAIATDGARLAAFETWCTATRAFLEQSRGGFAVVVPRLVDPPDATVDATGRILLPVGAKKALRVEITTALPRISALELELAPDASHSDSILRQGLAESTIRLSLRVRKKSGATTEPVEQAVPIRAAEGDRALPRYANGHAIRGIVGGWRVAAGDRGVGARAVYLLESPLVLGTDDTLLVTIDGAIGAARIGVSPCVTECGTSSTETLAAISSAPTPLADARVCGAYLRGTASDTEAFSALVALDRDLRECDFGRAPTVVTEAWDARPTRVLPRGNWQDESGPLVEPATPTFLPALAIPHDRRPNRLDLARWLVSPENPLTARVFVNRVWKLMFGVGLVATLDDFGVQGERPTHPEVLDTLALDFIASGYDVKALVRRVVTTAAYRRSADGRADVRERDPDNRLLARQSPRRLEAEFVRDNALAIGGLLVPDRGGPPVFPYQPPRLFEHLQFPDRDWYPSRDDRQWRRALYTHWQRTFLHPALVAFDAPSREECTAVRTVANTPQQALTLLNDPEFVEAARAFAARLLLDGECSDVARIGLAFELALARPPRSQELAVTREYLTARRAAIAHDPRIASDSNGVGLAPLPDVDHAELAAWTAVCRIILNLHECTTRY